MCEIFTNVRSFLAYCYAVAASLQPPFRRIFCRYLFICVTNIYIYGFPQIQDLPASSGIMQVSSNPASWHIYLNINPSIYTFSISLIDNGSGQAIGICCIIPKLLFLSASLLCRNPVSNYGCSQVKILQV
jgi:hypothetical protein